MGAKFFGLEAVAPWPDSFPKGRIIGEGSRHATLVFYGLDEISFKDIPPPPFRLGLVGQFLHPLVLRRVIAWEPDFFSHKEELLSYQKEITNEKRDWLPHVTLARSPFDAKEWKKGFTPLPALFPAFHLYESKGNLQYEKIDTYALILPFEEIPHTADVAYKIRGENFDQLYLHALTALAFEFPPLLKFREKKTFHSLNEVIASLGLAVAKGDAEYGAPLKAVSYHGEVVEHEFLEWEMIVDV